MIRLFNRKARAVEPPPAVNPPGEAERLLRRLDFTVIRRLDGLRQGEHRNSAYGFGMDLAELREYQPGDDVRALDWNVTARMDKPYVRRFHEDREVTAWLLLDLTNSTDFGSAMHTKREVLIDAAGTLARLLTAGGDKVGALVYTGSAPVRRRRTRARTWWGASESSDKMPAEVVHEGSGRQHVLHLLQRTMAASGKSTAAQALPRADRPPVSDLAALLEQAFRTARGRSLIIILSDFLDVTDLSGADTLGSEGNAQRSAWQRAFAPLARRHEVAGVWIRDPREVELPAVGVVTMQDAETGEQFTVDTTQPSFRAAFERLATERRTKMDKLFALHAAALWELSTAEPFVPALVRFLEQRRRTLIGARRLLRV